ncbi:MAG: type II toxin-antitoxin system RelE/ParE family toxin [Rhodoferax sp.]|nr:type II toxin-antitoxin system RelE/ParE family toxin [Rhodoferax sp.]
MRTHPNYIVVYRVERDVIDVLRVLHARQQYPT